MGVVLDAFTSVRDFFETGGGVLWWIFFVTVVMWTLIIERVWYFKAALPKDIQQVHQIWESRADQMSWEARRIREQLVSQISRNVSWPLTFMKALMAALPLLGLMGTVVGMIGVFEIMSVTGTGNARTMASGVYKATLPTMAGLVGALSGLYPMTYLERKADQEVEKVEDLLAHH